MKSMLKGVLRYARNIILLPLALIDNALNCLVLLGSPFESMSSHAGRVKIVNGGRIPRQRYLLRLVDWVTDWFDKNHVIEAAESNIGKLGVIDRGKS